MPNACETTAPLLEGAATTPTPDVHRATLRHLLHLARLQPKGADSAACAAQAQECRRLIEQGVAVAPNGPMSVFLEVAGWYGNLHVTQVFEAYVRAKYLQLNHAPENVLLPLEAAISEAHLDFFRACLDAGADERLVPTANNQVRYQGCWDEADDDDKPYELRDIHALIADEVNVPEIQAAMVASLREAPMNRRIRASSANATVPDPSPDGCAESSPRRRRASL